jgi:tripartite-type tricarboxylate transporter receptor subunit TctC
VGHIRWVNAARDPHPDAPAFRGRELRGRQSTKIVRRRFLRAAAAALVAGAFQRTGRADTYPTRPVRLIVPFAAGGNTDVIMRIAAQQLSARLGQPFYVENLAGAGGTTGTAVARKASPDGHTLLAATSGFIINPSLSAKTPFDPVKDFAPVTVIATIPVVLVVYPPTQARSLMELVALVKASPGTLSYAHAATGSSAHLSGELFKLRFGLDLVTVPFNGAAPAITSTMGGHTPIAFVPLSAAISNIRDGTLRALAVASPRRVTALPDVPTMAEAGAPDQESDALQGLVVPAGTPRPIIDLLHREIVQIVALPDVKERLAGLAFEPVANSPDEFAAQIKADIAKWSKVIRDAKITID